MCKRVLLKGGDGWHAVQDVVNIGVSFLCEKEPAGALMRCASVTCAKDPPLGIVVEAVKGVDDFVKTVHMFLGGDGADIFKKDEGRC